MRTLIRLCWMLALAAGLSACDDGRLDLDVSADRPATNLQGVFVTLQGVTLQRDDGSEQRIQLDEDVRIDLMRYISSDFSLITGEALDEGDYTSIRFDFRDNSSGSSSRNYVVAASGGQVPLAIDDSAADAFIPLDLSISTNGNTYLVRARFDLRLSLSENGDEYVLRPVVRAARDTRAASVSGSVRNSIVTSNSCRQGRSNGVGVAVYLFEGHDVEPDDYDGAEPDPIASSAVTQSSSSSDGWVYSIEVLQPGQYTLALTCDGDQERPDQPDDDIEFSIADPVNFTVDEGDDRDEDF